MSSNLTAKIVTRYAPSPTGFQHIGGIRTALFAYLYAQQQGGDFILRIEDTDKNREVAGAIQHTIDSLRWLGIEYDFGPDAPHPVWGSAIQSERVVSGLYHQYANKLIEQGLAYPDPYTAEEVGVFRAQAEANKKPFLYRDHRPEKLSVWNGSTPLRFKVPELKRYEWCDAVRGNLSAGVEALDDFILIKSDGYPTYNFAHIVDDIEMGVTHVMRGEEFISSLPKFLSLYEALGVAWPTFVTLPPILGPDGKKKLSKRDGAKDILEYGNDGYLPSAVRNFLALIGWNPGTEQEVFGGLDDLAAVFSLDKIQKSGGAFNEDKLAWINGEHLRRLTNDERVQYVLSALPDCDSVRLARLAPSILERSRTQAEIRIARAAGEYDWAFSGIDYAVEMLRFRQDVGGAAASLPRLQRLLTLLTTTNFDSAESIKSAIWPYAEEVGRGQVLWPFRVALTGQERSPDPFTCAYVLGQDETLKRVEEAINKLNQYKG